MSLRGVNVLRGSSSWPELHIFITSSSTSNSQRLCRRPTLLRPTGTLLNNQKPGSHNFGILPGQLHEHGHLLSAPVVRYLKTIPAFPSSVLEASMSEREWPGGRTNGV